jgi:superfamily II RNA helicase
VQPRALFKPDADGRLKSVFKSIGVPAATAFIPDPYQREALDKLLLGDCLVTAPTGAGKTWIAVEAMRRYHERRRRCWYACPLKALSNSKLLEFQGLFGKEAVGILTGDRRENPGAPIIVGTTEILRNQLYDAMHRGRQLGTDFVVLDEAHYLADPERGVVWEEVMIYLPARIPLLLLSATIGNADQIADWLSTMRGKPCLVVSERHRPVALAHLFLHPSGTLLPLLSARGGGGKVFLDKKVRQYLNRRPRPLLAVSHQLPPFADILSVLRRYRLLPCIFFLKSRADCDRALEICARRPTRGHASSGRRQSRVAELVSSNAHTAGNRQRWHLDSLGVAAHHGGQLPAWKLIVEMLMKEGLLEAVFATTTVAAGVNFPARTVAFLNSDRFNGREFLPLTATEFHQMTGRAGRRGMDNIGFALVIPTKFMDLALVARLVASPPSPVHSQININFSMVLNLLLSHTPEQIVELVARSFAAHQTVTLDKKRGGGKRGPQGPALLTRDFEAHLAFLQETGYVTKAGALSSTGIWASRLRIDQPLLVAEALRKRLFPKTTPSILAASVAVFVDEREADDDLSPSKGPEALKRAYAMLVRGIAPLALRLSQAGFRTRPFRFRAAMILHDWAGGIAWEGVCSRHGIADGDLAMLVLRTADNLRHIRALDGVFPAEAAAAAAAIDQLMRQPLVADLPF